MFNKVMFVHNFALHTWFYYSSFLASLLCVSGKNIVVQRDRAGDVFNNLFAKSNTDRDGTFCRSCNSFCYDSYPSPPNKCTHCLCSQFESTFIAEKLACVDNNVLRAGMFCCIY